MNLGVHNDILKGLGGGRVHAGAGINKLLFGQGAYIIIGFTIVFSGVTTNANEFERVGGFIGRLFAYRDGTLTIDSDGVATFAA